ncbi:hypothetical protein [Lentzea flava]|uniref:Uncharacterized protein n=1 Tax=Lentzea flava TaxID=103732 RepID=A0ABQ2UFD8_9PSEU|nr:hypothetical protein [Lentzea flava]MCP2198748.1 hypothetical protein [Lentzea flava]GGU29771.1 hypothetical protein GCM10010178_22580 [Lentzea flava]
MSDWTPWDEGEYLAYLETERAHFAWVMRHYGGLSEEEARRAAVEFYEYEPPDASHRGFVFHEVAWHWAMEHLMAGCDYPYWHTHPVPEPPPDYPGYVAPEDVARPTPGELDALRRKLGGG